MEDPLTSHPSSQPLPQVIHLWVNVASHKHPSQSAPLGQGLDLSDDERPGRQADALRECEVGMALQAVRRLHEVALAIHMGARSLLLEEETKEGMDGDFVALATLLIAAALQLSVGA